MDNCLGVIAANRTTLKMHMSGAIASLASPVGCCRVSAALHASVFVLIPEDYLSSPTVNRENLSEQ